MSQPSETSATYTDSWRALQRLIQEGGSLSGHERNVFYANCGDGRFADVSAAAGLDFDEDGRAFAAADLDQDGDLDIVLKSRSGPQIRILRNDVGNRSGAIAFDLGPRAVGVTLRIENAKGKRLKEVKVGSGFLSQSSPHVWFGLGDEAGVAVAEVSWADGSKSRYQDLAAGSLYRAGVHGQLQATDFRQASPLPEVTAAPSARDSGLWLMDPPPAPSFELGAIDGTKFRLEARLEKPVLINFWATWCPPCRKEMQDLAPAAHELKRHGLDIVAISLDEAKDREAVERFAADVALPFPVLLSDARVVDAYSLVYRQLLGGRRELPLPFSLLIDRDATIARVYIGAVKSSKLVADLESLSETRRDTLGAATPFAGSWIGAKPEREFAAAAQEFLNDGIYESARRYYERAAAQRDLNPSQWNNLALAQGASGDAEAALRSLRRAVGVDPSFAEGWQNLGIILLRSEHTKEGVEALERSRRLGHESYPLYHHLGLAYEITNRPSEAISAFQAAHRLDGSQADPLIELGALYLAADRKGDAAYVLRTAANLESAKALDVVQSRRLAELLARIDGSR